MTEAPIKFWSFSALKTFEKCPYEIYLARVERSPKPEPREDSPLVRGNVIHKEAEAYIQGTGPLTKNLKKVEAILTEFQTGFSEGRVEVEQNWCFDADWKPTDWDGKTCIVKCDAVEWITDTSAHFADWKSGKSWGKEVAHTQQGQLYAIATLMRKPEVLTVKSTFAYTDEGKVNSRIYTRTMLPALIERYESRAKKLLTATDFPPKANRGSCRWCSYSPNEGGTGVCPYGVEA